MMRARIIPIALLIACCVCKVQATPVFYHDTHAVSENGRYKVEAKSPDNERGNWKKPFARNFTYTLTDLHTKKTLWERKQGEEEASCKALYPDDDGWVVIATGENDLILVSPQGQDRGTVNILQDSFTEDERKQYVHFTTAGPSWAGYSLWYFVREQQRRLFVIRPWWGRRVIADVKAGVLIPQDTEIATACLAHERAFVLSELAQGVKTREKWEQEYYRDAVRPILLAAFLAGRLPVSEAAPLLEELQDVAYIGRGVSRVKHFEGEVDPHSYRTFTLRQVVQLSLRRLGKTPRPLPANQFDVHYESYDKNHPYLPKPLNVPRESNASTIKAGMKAEQVLDLLGSPDFVGYDTWEYDMDANPSFSLILKWDALQVIEIQRKTPVLWKEGFTRDIQVVR